MRVFVAGATGAVGTVLVPELRKSGIEVTPHVRPATAAKHPMGKDPEAVICDLGDLGKVDAAMVRCDAVACLVGTMRSRFRDGDTYESSDFLPVVELVEAATRDAKKEFKERLHEEEEHLVLVRKAVLELSKQEMRESFVELA